MTETNSQRTRFLSLGTKMTVPVVLLVALVALGAYFAVARTARVNAVRSKEAAADMVVKLTSYSIAPALVFGDEAEMQRSIGDLARNPEVLDVELWGLDAAGPLAAAPLAGFHRQPGQTLGRPSSVTSHRALTQESLSAVEPVLALDGKVLGTLAVLFSTARESAAAAQLTRQFFYFSVAIAACLAIAILLVISRMVVAPLRHLQQAARHLAHGGIDHVKNAGTAPRFEDEVIELTATFEEMASAVRDREARLALRNADLQLVLDSVDQGFLTARPDGSLLPERSAILETWAGELPSDATLWDLAGRIDAAARAPMANEWIQLVDGFLPVEVAIDQLPKRLNGGGRHYEFDFRPVMSGDVMERLVIVLTDITSDVERQRVLADQHEFSLLVDFLVRDQRAFQQFWQEASQLAQRITGDSSKEAADSVRRDLHTLKGNARQFGIGRVGTLCHTLEDALADRGTNVLLERERNDLRELWDSLRRRIEPLMQGSTGSFRVADEDHAKLLDAVRRHAASERLEALVRGLRCEPTLARLERAREALRATCVKLGKTPPDVSIEHNNLRLLPDRWASFWIVLPHVLSNAVDHGLESDRERLAVGKPLPGSVRLSTELVAGQVVFEVSDDGRGIDWAAVRAQAKRRGLPCDTQQELEETLFMEGFSLKESASEISGRGVGLSAVQAVLIALRGTIEVDSKMGQGTTWRFRCPVDASEVDTNSLEQPNQVGPRESSQHTSTGSTLLSSR